MYNLLIVDDEEDIREGLADMIDWTSLGFSVMAKLPDGSDAISYLQAHRVDVILTDIKMVFASGIDVARYVYENKLEIKVIILSGFQEFALAREAIRYNVVHYFLKPTDLDEVEAVFKRLAQELDEERRAREQQLIQNQHVKTLKQLLMEQFFFNLLFGEGWSKDEGELSRKLRQLSLDIDPAKARTSLMTVCWSGLPVEGNSQREPEKRQAISIAITKEYDRINYVCIHRESGKFVIICNALNDCASDDFQKRVEQYFLQIQRSVSSLLGLTVRLDQMEIYPSLLALLTRNEEQSPVLDIEVQTPSEGETRNDNNDRIIIRSAKHYIAEYFEMDLTLTSVSMHVGLNPVYFSRLFKQETGQTYSDYVIDLRIKKAVDYLRDPKYKVYEIGYLVGYKNTKYFHKLFKRQTGFTPSEYRDQL
ncbi:response regulator [Paenibacillus agaridevorans]|uniref:response regulator n=1 Tax=Paenibacillus agaridevorans TaxID=171404 RepID=UPI001BE49328|nr:helix-turn-helix domain-containing protein [Paenibacillus agaridevorans]